MPERLSLVGLAFLEWDEAVRFTPVGFTERMAQLGKQRTFPSLASDPVAMLDLASRPMVRAGRPRGLRTLPRFGAALRDYFA